MLFAVDTVRHRVAVPAAFRFVKWESNGASPPFVRGYGTGREWVHDSILMPTRRWLPVGFRPLRVCTLVIRTVRELGYADIAAASRETPDIDLIRVNNIFSSWSDAGCVLVIGGRGRVMTILILVYSRSGITRDVAERIARACGATKSEIRDVRSRAGVFGYLRSGYEAVKALTPAIQPLTVDPAAYDLVILGAPVWAGHVATPMRTFLTQNKSRLPRVAFFCTMGGSGAERALLEMAEGAAQVPIATLALADRDVNSDAGAQKIQRFVAVIRALQGPLEISGAPEETGRPAAARIREFTVGGKDGSADRNAPKGDAR